MREFAFSIHKAHVAQLVEHVLGKDEVTRSIRVVGSIISMKYQRGLFPGFGDFSSHVGITRFPRGRRF